MSNAKRDQEWGDNLARIENEAGGFPGVSGSLVRRSRESDARRFGTAVPGWRWMPVGEFIFVVDYGQPLQTKSGIFLGDYDHGSYKFDTWRYGEVIAIGPGKLTAVGQLPMPDIKLGDVVCFSRKHGTRLPGEVRFHHPTYTSKDGLLVRVLDPDKTVAVVHGFTPWWDVVASARVNPGSMFSG